MWRAIGGPVDAAGLLQRSHPRVYRGGSEFYSLERLWSDAAPVDVSQYLTQD